MKTSLRRYCFASLLLSTVSGAASYGQTLPVPSHIVVLIEENYAYADIIGSSYAPHINAIAADTNAAVFSNFCALAHPSQPNYIEFFSGNDQGVTTDDPPTTYPWTTPNLGAELLSASKTFITYSENLPSAGSEVVTYTSGGANYARKHNPCANWTGTGTNQIPASVNQPFTAFPTSTNYSSLPTVSFVVPNMTNDMHDGSGPANIILGDNWEYANMDALRAWTLTNNTLLIIIYDEDNDNTPNNNIPFILYGPMVKGGKYAENATFYNLLRTIEDMYGLGYAGNAATATAITDCWKTTTSTINTGVGNVANNNFSFKVMPNPASDVITFSCNNPLNAQLNISVTDEAGRMAGKYNMSGADMQVNISSFAPGVYYYRVNNDSNNTVSVGKFVVAHN